MMAMAACHHGSWPSSAVVAGGTVSGHDTGVPRKNEKGRRASHVRVPPDGLYTACRTTRVDQPPAPPRLSSILQGVAIARFLSISSIPHPRHSILYDCVFEPFQQNTSVRKTLAPIRSCRSGIAIKALLCFTEPLPVAMIVLFLTGLAKPPGVHIMGQGRRAKCTDPRVISIPMNPIILYNRALWFWLGYCKKCEDRGPLVCIL